MSIYLKPGVLKVKDENNNYVQVNNLFAKESIQYHLDTIDEKGAQTQAAIDTIAAQAISNITTTKTQATTDINATVTQATNTITTKANQAINSIPQDYTNLSNEVSDLKADLTQSLGLKVNKPLSSPNGIAGQLLRTQGNGNTEWSDVGTPSDAQVGSAVSDWLDAHPEATTTVDFSIAVKVFPTVASMIADSTLKNGDNVATRGYYESGDNGGTNYVVSTTSAGAFYIELVNGLFANRLSESDIIRAETIGIKAYSTSTENPDSSDMASNTVLFQKAVNAGRIVLFGIGHFYFDNQIGFPINAKMQQLLGMDRHLSRLYFPNSAGIVFDSIRYYNHIIIAHLGIESYGTCILCEEAIANLMDCHFEYLILKSLNGNCFEAPTYNVSKYTYGDTDRVVYDTAVQNSVFDVIDGQADNGAVFANIMGLGNQYKHLNIIGATLYAFRNCDGRIEHLNTLGTGLTYFIYYDKAFSHSLVLDMKYVNAEGVRGAFIYTEPEVNVPAGEDPKKPTTANVMTISQLILENSGWSLHGSSGDAHSIYPITVHAILSIDIIGGSVTGVIPTAYPSRYDTNIVKGHIRELRTRALARLSGVPTIQDVALSNGIVYTIYGKEQNTVLGASEGHSDNGTKSVPTIMKAKICELNGGKATQIWKVKASEYASQTIDPPEEYRFCDVIAFNIDTSNDKSINLLCPATINNYPGRIITIFNESASNNDVEINHYGIAGYGRGMFAINEKIVLEPNSSMTFVTTIWTAPNGNKYNAWKPLF